MKKVITNVISLHWIQYEHKFVSQRVQVKLESLYREFQISNLVMTVSLHVIFFIDPVSDWLLPFCGAQAHSDAGWCCNPYILISS